MFRTKPYLLLAALCASLLLAAPSSAAQKNRKEKQAAQTTGSVRGHVKVAQGASPSGVEVTVQRGDDEVARARTDAKGEFEVQGLAPGSYGLTLRKAGLQVGRLDGVEVRAGKTVTLKEGLYLPVDEGSIAFIRGSVFSSSGRSFNGVKVELARVESDGSLKKLDGRVTTESGSFSFRLTPETARYRVTARADGMTPVSKDVEVEGAMVYRVALSLGQNSP